MQIRALVACGVVLVLALGAGWWTAARIDTRSSAGPAAAPPALTDPHAPSAEVLPPQDSPVVITPPPATGPRAPVTPPPVAADPPGTAGPEPAPAPTTITREDTTARPPATTTRPRPPQAPREPEPITTPRTTTRPPVSRPQPETRPAAPAVPRVVSTSSPPPETRRIAADQAFTGSDAAHRALVEARRRAPAGSLTDRAIARQSSCGAGTSPPPPARFPRVGAPRSHAHCAPAPGGTRAGLTPRDRCWCATRTA